MVASAPRWPALRIRTISSNRSIFVKYFKVTSLRVACQRIEHALSAAVAFVRTSSCRDDNEKRRERKNATKEPARRRRYRILFIAGAKCVAQASIHPLLILFSCPSCRGLFRRDRILVVNSLCRAQEKRTMREPEVLSNGGKDA